jgi:hypothetical protein
VETRSATTRLGRPAHRTRIAQVRGHSLGCVNLVIRNAAEQTQHVVASYRPRSSVLLFARLLGEKFAGSPIAEHFLASES